jgi:hypothetical protein
MNLKTSSAILLMILLTSCATASPTPLSTLTPTTTPIPSETPTPQPTGTNTVSPTPELTLNGLAPTLDEFPAITHEQEWQLLQKAIANRSLTLEFSNGFPYASLRQMNQIDNKDNQIGTGVRLACNFGLKSCDIVASYQVDGLHKIMLEFAVMFEDGTKGSVILPIVIDMDSFDPAQSDLNYYTRNRLRSLSRSEQGGYIDYINIATNLDRESRVMENPTLQVLVNEALQEGSRTRELLTKMHTLAKDNRSLSQEEINELIDALIWY